jgi:hypothetical protein
MDRRIERDRQSTIAFFRGPYRLEQDGAWLSSIESSAGATVVASSAVVMANAIANTFSKTQKRKHTACRAQNCNARTVTKK